MVRREPGRNDQERKPEARNRISFVFTRPLWMAWHEAGTSNCGVSLLCPVRFASKTLTSVEKILADFAGLSPRMVEPSLKEGMVSIPGSMLIRSAAGWRKYIPDSSRFRRLRKGLERVRRDGGVFHVWLHPEDLYAEWPRLENVVARFLEELGA